ncbi:MAG: POTRA domain-containing protein [Bacteroidia bacterium]
MQKYVVINAIYIVGNKVTKRSVVTRELNFSEGDTLSEKIIFQTLNNAKENLLNTSLFNFVTIDTSRESENKIDITITLAERWYTWPEPILSVDATNFNTWWLTKDLSKINYGINLLRYNFLGLNQTIGIRIQDGYDQQLGIFYSIPYINKKQNSGLGFAVVYARNHEIDYATKNNVLEYYNDLNGYARTNLYERINYSNRQGIYNRYFAELRYNKCSIADSLQTLATNYFSENTSSMNFFSAYAAFTCDHRDSKPYPLKGYYLGIGITKLGLGILQNTNLDVLFVEASARKYWKLSNRFYFASELKGKISDNNAQPYYVERALGYNDYVRGYEYYVINGQNFGLMKNELRYEIIKPRVQKIKFLKWEKFNKPYYALYASIFSDIAYVQDNENFLYNNLANSWIYGSGVGLDLTTYYDGVFRIEYSVNRQMQSGFFLHFTAPL